MFEIEKNVPASNDHIGAPARYPFSSMEIGDSFFVPGVTAATMSHRSLYWARKLKFKFKVRTVDGGCRVWRTE